jgi:hypothetical protein
MKLFPKVLLLAAMASATVAFAQVESRQKDLVVLQPQDLPQDTRNAGQSMDLYSLGNGETYLYIEQHQLGRLVILDVTDPARIKQVGIANLQTPAPFYFSSSLGDFTDLVCFRDRPGFAVMDFKNPREPQLTTSSALAQEDQAKVINGLLMTSAGQPACGESPQDYNIFDTSQPQVPQILGTVRNVQKTLVRTETGTTFLLGEDGLTVVRRPNQEETYSAESSYTN